jgi:4-hydroxybenzoate polyprenyltransferase
MLLCLGMSAASGRILLKLEGGFWLTRPQSLFGKFPLTWAGWLVGLGAAAVNIKDVALLALFVAVYQALLMVLNDWIDAEKDRRSAPYLPIPSGVVRRSSALLEGLGFGIAFLTLLWVLGSDFRAVAITLATIPPALATIKIYGRTKSAWYSPVLASTAAASGPLWGWLLAGHRNPALFGQVFAIAMIHGLHTNLRAQLRDIEGDPKAGNVTVAVRLGAKKTFWLTIALRAVELGGIGMLCLSSGKTGAWFWLVAAFLVFAGNLTRAKEYERSRSRLEQTKVLTVWIYASLLAEIAVLGVFQPLAAGATLVFMFVWYNAVRSGYRIRIEQGGLASDWRRLDSGFAEPAAAQAVASE